MSSKIITTEEKIKHFITLKAKKHIKSDDSQHNFNVFDVGNAVVKKFATEMNQKMKLIQQKHLIKCDKFLKTLFSTWLLYVIGKNVQIYKKTHEEIESLIFYTLKNGESKNTRILDQKALILWMNYCTNKHKKFSYKNYIKVFFHLWRFVSPSETKKVFLNGWLGVFKNDFQKNLYKFE